MLMRVARRACASVHHRVPGGRSRWPGPHTPEPEGAVPLCEHLWCRAQYPVILANDPNSTWRGRSRGSDGRRAGFQTPSPFPHPRLEGMGRRRSPGEGWGLGQKSSWHFWDTRAGLCHTPRLSPSMVPRVLGPWAFLLAIGHLHVPGRPEPRPMPPPL